MKIILAVICFLAMIVHGLFGYYLFINGEAVFEPDNMIVALHKKTEASPDIYSLFAKPQASLKKEGFKNPFDKTESALVKVGEVEQGTPVVQNTETEQKAEESAKTSGASEAVHPMLPSGTVQVGKVATPSEPTPIVKEPSSPTPQESQPEKTEEAKTPEAKPEFLPFSTGWSGFLQVENALITVTLFLLGFSVCCVKGRGPASRWVFFCNLVFWATLSGIIWFFHPVKTPFAMVNLKFNFPEWYIIIGASGLATLLSLLLYLNAFRKPVDSLVKKPEKAPENQPKKIEEPAKPSRFGFSHKAKPEEKKIEPAAVVTPNRTPTENSSSE